VFELCADEVAAGGYDAVDGVNLGGGEISWVWDVSGGYGLGFLWMLG